MTIELGKSISNNDILSYTSNNDIFLTWFITGNLSNSVVDFTGVSLIIFCGGFDLLKVLNCMPLYVVGSASGG